MAPMNRRLDDFLAAGTFCSVDPAAAAHRRRDRLHSPRRMAHRSTPGPSNLLFKSRHRAPAGRHLERESYLEEQRSSRSHRSAVTGRRGLCGMLELQRVAGGRLARHARHPSSFAPRTPQASSFRGRNPDGARAQSCRGLLLLLQQYTSALASKAVDQHEGVVDAVADQVTADSRAR